MARLVLTTILLICPLSVACVEAPAPPREVCMCVATAGADGGVSVASVSSCVCVLSSGEADTADAGMHADATVVTVNCPALPHQGINLVPEPDGSLTCLPGPCDPGWRVCNEPENGCATDISLTDNCGVCGNRCASGVCVAHGGDVFVCAP